MLKRVLLLLLAVFFFMTQDAFGVSKSELKRMSIFVSNFLEVAEYGVNLDNFDIDTVTMNDLLAFGIWHNYLNNHSLVKSIEDDNNYNCSISAKYVAASVRKYFALPVRHQDVNIGGSIFPYKNGIYYFNMADGVSPRAEVQESSRKGNVITMRGKLLFNDAEDAAKEEVIGEFIATAKPHKWNGKNTWAILSLKSTFYD